ncbi:hypothetical protein MMC21_002938 [Puttea exsequens]|nr:hypothetical protein [Puttea exsequens]
MSTPRGKVIEGVFGTLDPHSQFTSSKHLQLRIAINKPPSITSAQVIRNLQRYFNPSALFAPWLAVERVNRKEVSRGQNNRRRDKRIQVKIGHGGTLDPMATGVLIMGIGKGTKQLQDFLECTKTYEATVLFGAATDSYDVLGKVLKRAKYQHVTRERVEEALPQFRGKIKQRPPIYSALRIDGKRLYEYAREGKEVPRNIEQRPVEVKEMEVLEWMDGGNHQHALPKEEAEKEAQDVVEKVLHFDESVIVPRTGNDSATAINAKRKRPVEDEAEPAVSNKRPALDSEETIPPAMMSGGLQGTSQEAVVSVEHEPAVISNEDVRLESQDDALSTESGPPAVKLRMTVTSGFYVRSLSHDLGEAVGSLACMSELVRTKQGHFELGKNVLEYDELEKGELNWGPKVGKLLDNWKMEHENLDERESNGTVRKPSCQ